MKKTIVKFIASSLFATTLITVPLNLGAQEATNNNVSGPEHHKAKKHDHLVFTGKLTAIDKNAQTLTVGARTFEINSDTKIINAGKPATLSEGVVGEPVSGAYKKTDDGKLMATSIRFGAKPESEKKKKKVTSPDSTGSTTNGVPN